MPTRFGPFFVRFSAVYVIAVIAFAAFYGFADGMPREVAVLHSMDRISGLGNSTGEWTVIENGVEVERRLETRLSKWAEKIEACLGPLLPAFLFAWYFYNKSLRKSARKIPGKKIGSKRKRPKKRKGK